MIGQSPGTRPAEIICRTAYLLFGLGCMAGGLWLLIDPAGWNSALRLVLEDFTGANGEAQAPLLRRLGAAYLCVSLAFFWCLANPSVRRRVHSVLLLFFSLQALIQIGELLGQQLPSHRWVTDAPLVLLPPLLLLLMMFALPAPVGRSGRPTPPARNRPARPEHRPSRRDRPVATVAGTAPIPAAVKPQAHRGAADTPEETGEVKWFDRRKGYGFINRPDGSELFVHFRQIRDPSGQTWLENGQPVRYRIGPGLKGPQAEDVTPI